MDSHKLIILFLIISSTIGCSPVTLTPNIQASPTETNAIATTPPAPSATTAVPSATPEPDSPEGCADLAETPLNTDVLNGLLVVFDFDNFTSYFLEPKSNQLLDIEAQTQVLWDAPATNVRATRVSPNNKLIQADLWDKDYAIIRTADEVIKTYDTQGQEDWNRGRWLDNERMVFQHWLDAPYGSYTIVIFNPFTGEQKNMQFDLPNPYIVLDTGGRVSWVKADIDPSLKRVLYNDKDEKLVLWDLDTQKEIASLPSPTDLIEGTWSPNGKEFAIPSPSQTSDISAASELFMMDMDGTVKKLTDFNQKYPFANVGTWPSWSPNGRYIAFWLKISNIPNPNPDDLRQWLAIIDTTTLETQVYCFSPNKPPRSGGGIGWSPDSTQVIINPEVFFSEEVKPVLVDLSRRTQTTLDTHGLFVAGWMSP